jgi:CRISPR-associated endonuclease/helicase Cas3
LLSELGLPTPLGVPVSTEPSLHEREILALDAEVFDLVAYLVCSHHGKVRASWHASPADQEAVDASGELTIRGIRTGDELTVCIGLKSGEDAVLKLDLSPSASGLSERTGRSWAERVLALRKRLGPFALAWLEATLRAADQRASRIVGADPLLATEAKQ